MGLKEQFGDKKEFEVLKKEYIKGATEEILRRNANLNKGDSFTKEIAKNLVDDYEGFCERILNRRRDECIGAGFDEKIIKVTKALAFKLGYSNENVQFDESDLESEDPLKVTNINIDKEVNEFCR